MGSGAWSREPGVVELAGMNGRARSGEPGVVEFADVGRVLLGLDVSRGTGRSKTQRGGDGSEGEDLDELHGCRRLRW